MAGWNGSGMGGNSTPQKPKAAAKKQSAYRGLLAGVICVAVIAVLVFIVFSPAKDVPENRLKESPKSLNIPQKKPARVSHATVVTNTNGTVSMKVAAVERRPPLEQTRESVAPPAPLADVAEKIKPPSLPFKTATENFIAMAIPSSPGAGVPPIPFPDGVDFTEDMKKAFSTPITAEEGDSEETINRKIAVLDHKDELQELATKEGWTMQEYVNAIREKYLQANDYLAECHETLEQAYADPDIDDASYIAMRDKINETLKERGLPEIMSSAEDAARMEAEESERETHQEEKKK